MKNFLFVFLLLAGCTIQPPQQVTATVTTTSTATQTAVETKPSPVIPITCPVTPPAGCPVKGEYQAIDIAGPVDQKLLTTLRCAGIHTVMRYYDWPGQESIKGKIPKADELALLKKNGMNFLGVFQHYNSSLSTFTAERGKIDAEKALGLAKLWGQPKGSAIYFGVDGDFYGSTNSAKVAAYFKAATPLIRAAGFRVGMYGSGGNCTMLKAMNLVDGELCWIAASSWGWSGTKSILATGKGYALAQKVNQKCEGKSLDYNKVLIPDFGQWKLP